MRLSKKYKSFLLVVAVLTGLFLANPTLAESSIIPQECLDDLADNCGLTQIVQLFANLYNFMLKYLGALALLLFVIGGIMFITSGGSQEKVMKAKKILTGTTVGLIIVMLSFVIVQQLQKSLIAPDQQKNYVIKSTNTSPACSIEGGVCTQPNEFNTKEECEEANPGFVCQTGLCGPTPNIFCKIPN